jgi:hypothetical protein
MDLRVEEALERLAQLVAATPRARDAEERH